MIATKVSLLPRRYNQEAAQLHSCLNRQQVVVRNDDLGMGGREYRVTIADTKGSLAGR